MPRPPHVYMCIWEMGVLSSSVLYLGLFWNMNDDPNALATEYSGECKL